MGLGGITKRPNKDAQKLYMIAAVNIMPITHCESLQPGAMDIMKSRTTNIWRLFGTVYSEDIVLCLKCDNTGLLK